MRRISVIIIFAALLFTVCDHEKSMLFPPNYPDGYGNLKIDTEQTEYTWDKHDNYSTVRITGTLNNKSGSTFYSNMRDPFGASDRLYVARGSDGYFELFDETDNSWKESHIRSPMIEGTMTTPVPVDETFIIDAFMYRNPGEEITGLFRIRVDYYDQFDPPSGTEPYYDYSNVFEIR